MRQTVRTRLIAWIALPTLLIYIIVIGSATLFVQRTEEAQAREMTTSQASSYARQFDLLLSHAATVAEGAARMLEVEPNLTERQIYSLLESNVANHPFVYGSACAFEPGTYLPGDELYSPYVHRDGETLRRMNIDRSVYDWYRDPAWTWFSRPKELGRGVWSEPYFDEGAGNVLMTTYSAPFFQHGNFRGVVTIDLKLPDLHETIGRALDPQLEFVVLARDGTFIYSPDTERILTQTVYEFAEEFQRPDLARAARTALSGAPGVAEVDGWDSPDRQWLFFAPIHSTEWTFLSRLPESVALGAANRKSALLAGMLATTLALTVGAIYLVSKRITAPIVRLKEKVNQIAHGDLNARVQHITGTDEVAELARSFNKMTDDLQRHIHRLAEEEAARKQVDRELDLARDIQMRLLPADSPCIPGYDIAGWSQPAQKTGGDYYDWQALPSGRLVVSIADATGHGIGPALVTSVCRAYARASFSSAETMERLVARINRLLAEDLQGGYFVTFAAALLDARDHSVKMISAGHGPLMRYHARQRRLERLGSEGFPLAILPDAEYGPVRVLRLEPGDFLCLMTDGFYEWMNRERRIFGLARLQEAVQSVADRPAAEIIRAAYGAVLGYAVGQPQQDDVTAVVIKRVR